ncbi:hypothetical protein D3C86_2027940 [compost metagenome]
MNIQVVYLVLNMEHGKFVKVKEEINFKLMEIVKEYRSDFAYPTQRSISDHSIQPEQ